MTTGSPNHEVEDSDEETNYSETVQYYDEEATAKRWYSPMAAGIKWALWAGHNESSTAERGGRPAYSKLETRRSDELDWRDLNVPIVSSYSVRGTYTMSSAPLHLFTSSRRRIVSSQHCVASVSIVLHHSFIEERYSLPPPSITTPLLCNSHHINIPTLLRNSTKTFSHSCTICRS
jgi:hypothetical protein